MMRSSRKQKGMSSLMLLYLLSSIGFFVLCAFKIVPLYAENRYIQEAMRALGDSSEPINDMSKSKIKKTLQKFYMVNNIRSPGANEITVERSSVATIVHVDYDVNVPLFMNISVVLSFENYLDSRKPGECCKPPFKANTK